MGGWQWSKLGCRFVDLGLHVLAAGCSRCLGIVTGRAVIRVEGTRCREYQVVVDRSDIVAAGWVWELVFSVGFKWRWIQWIASEVASGKLDFGKDGGRENIQEENVCATGEKNLNSNSEKIRNNVTGAWGDVSDDEETSLEEGEIHAIDLDVWDTHGMVEIATNTGDAHIEVAKGDVETTVTSPAKGMILSCSPGHVEVIFEDVVGPDDALGKSWLVLFTLLII
ncbi:hypothetical protein NE237_008179 [Protea cynaroides]|uniref:Uncharacterized protein n=1 Tax=Protea cynaroides TaxID=273540 RepID=A0A9Q0KQW5_9MAGN|nr:hypothetical protein NE237_008179 [Protea cynaroides]